MAEKLPFGEGASINSPPLFYGLNYQFWKVKMKFFVKSVDRGIWHAITNGHFIPKAEKDKVFIEKPWCEWTVKARELNMIACQEYYHFCFEL